MDLPATSKFLLHKNTLFRCYQMITRRFICKRNPSLKLLCLESYRMATNFGEANIWRLAENLQLAKF